jgi:nifR3 family TIM-barrel protein
MSSELFLGPVCVRGRAWTAPMTGVTDLPFRRVAAGLGAAYIATEMVAGESLIAAQPRTVRRAAVGPGLGLMVIQLVGADPRTMGRAAALARRAGANIIDINFGCPAKSVTGIACGSALMRQPHVAREIVDQVVGEAGGPVTIKIRLGWDDDSRNAPAFAAMAQSAGVSAVTVHGRTRQQFYSGAADWAAVGDVKRSVDIPVIVNGDIVDVASARRAMAASGADGVMIGRGALGRPWLPAVIDAGLRGQTRHEPGPNERTAVVLDHLADSARFYGEALGVRMFRKHLAAYVDHAPWPASPAERRLQRARLCRLESQGEIATALTSLWAPTTERLAA